MANERVQTGVSSDGIGPLPRRLRDLPLAWRALLTVVLLFLGAGYVAALANIYGQNELNDGQPGLSALDLTLKYSGDWMEVPPEQSRMLEMVRGQMRRFVAGPERFLRLVSWLKAGGDEKGFAAGPPPTPRDILAQDCMRCHAADSGKEIGERSPFGPTADQPEFALVAAFSIAPDADGPRRIWREPREWRQLALTTHAHLLSVPMFVALLGVLYLWTGWPAGSSRARLWLRGVLACGPLAFFLADVACWWLARLPTVGRGFALTIGLTGALFGVTYVVQWLVVFGALWSPRRVA